MFNIRLNGRNIVIPLKSFWQWLSWRCYPAVKIDSFSTTQQELRQALASL